MFESNFLAYLLYLHSIKFVSANLFCSSMEIYSHNWIQSKTILDMTPVVSLLGIVLRSSFLFSLPTTHDDVVFAVSQN